MGFSKRPGVDVSHTLLKDRGASDSHPVAAITNLDQTLNLHETAINNNTANITQNSSDITKHTNGWINVKTYGAVGDGITNDTQAFLDSISNCPTGGKIFIPNGNYLITQQLAITKNITIVGTNIQDDTQNSYPLMGSILNFNSTTSISSAIKINADGVKIENIFINNKSTPTSNIPIGVQILPFIGGVVWNIDLKAIYVKNFPTHGFYAQGLLVSTIDHCFSSACGNGFYLDGGSSNGTSVALNNCWALNCTGYGYYLSVYYYCTLNTCASDGNNIGYWFSDCKGITLNSCGIEGSKKEHMYLNNTSEFTAISCFGANANTSNTADSNVTFLLATSTCKNVTLIGCKDFSPANGIYSVSIGSGKITCLNCNFPLLVVMNSQGYTFNNDSLYIANAPFQAPIPTSTTGNIGNWQLINVASGGTYYLPSGGTWIYFITKYNNGAFDSVISNFAVGGAQIMTAAAGISGAGFCWRLS
jgi:hypothetical protein